MALVGAVWGGGGAKEDEHRETDSKSVRSQADGKQSGWSYLLKYCCFKSQCQHYNNINKQTLISVSGEWFHVTNNRIHKARLHGVKQVCMTFQHRRLVSQENPELTAHILLIMMFTVGLIVRTAEQTHDFTVHTCRTQHVFTGCLSDDTSCDATKGLA